jgi:hypothetical protein
MEHSLSKSGAVISGRGDTPNRHDVPTGSDHQGNLMGNACEDSTTSGEGTAVVGHHDRTCGGATPEAWSSAHSSRGCGLCRLEALRGTGGNGRFYCFATN